MCEIDQDKEQTSVNRFTQNCSLSDSFRHHGDTLFRTGGASFEKGNLLISFGNWRAFLSVSSLWMHTYILMCIHTNTKLCRSGIVKTEKNRDVKADVHSGHINARAESNEQFPCTLFLRVKA
ncbi:putative myosin heavy chain [Toxoplasma gondii VAND]|uniref:Putative myosin heavy chain n=1 Tax=Toxoplasma gondii VAND TaxID=933077 RepID=A0A086QL91_TOXGO|nr:putative myosin heavy chain [Toxoplasma gondii VAND]